MARVPTGGGTGGSGGGSGVTPAQLMAAIDALKDDAPAQLDTLKELATSLGNQINAAQNLQNGIDFVQARADHAEATGGTAKAEAENALALIGEHVDETLGAHQASAIAYTNPGVDGEQLKQVLDALVQRLQQTANDASGAVGQVAGLQLDIDDIHATGLHTLVGRYDFADQGGEPGNYTLHAPGTTNPVLVRSAVTHRVFVAIGCHFIVHDALVQAGGSVAFGFESVRPALTGGGAKTIADLKLDGSAGQLVVTNPFAAAQPFTTAPNAYDGMAFRINDEPVTAGRIDVVAFGYEIPESLLA